MSDKYYSPATLTYVNRAFRRIVEELNNEPIGMHWHLEVSPTGWHRLWGYNGIDRYILARGSKKIVWSWAIRNEHPIKDYLEK